MKCFYHYEKDSQSSCCMCAHPLCGDCTIDVNGKIYCRECIQKAQKEAQPDVHQKPAAAAAPAYKSSALATWLSVLPGLGFIYLGLYLKGIAIFAAWIALTNLSHSIDRGFTPLVSIAFFVFQLVYTNQEAKRLNREKAGIAEAEKEKKEEGSFLWGTIVVIIGILFLIHNFGFDLSWIVRFWPLIVIGLGAQLIWNSLRREKEA